MPRRVGQKITRIRVAVVRRRESLCARLKGMAASILLALSRVILNKYVIGAAKALRQDYARRRHEELLSRFQSLGYGVDIDGEICVTDPSTIVVGNNVHIGEACYFLTGGGLTIGDDTHIGRNVTISTQSHTCNGRALLHDGTAVVRPVSIGKNVWIDMNVSIAPGVRIGDGVTVAMGTHVSCQVPDRASAGCAATRILQEKDAKHCRESHRATKYGGESSQNLDEGWTAEYGRHLTEEDNNLFFVLSTGRSGTRSIASILSMHPDMTCIHEGRPQLIRLSTELAHGEKSKTEAKLELGDLYSAAVVPDGIYGESNQKFWNLVTLLDALFPKCRFVWLIRDGRDVVASTHSRGWFSSDEKIRAHPAEPGILRWHYYRLDGAKCGRFAPEQWARLSVFEKNCWYWAHVNKVIGEELSGLSEDRWIKIRVEDLDAKLAELVTFLGGSPHVLKAARENVATGKLRSWDRWSATENKQFEHWCGEQMHAHYPGWVETGP